MAFITRLHYLEKLLWRVEWISDRRHQLRIVVFCEFEELRRLDLQWLQDKLDFFFGLFLGFTFFISIFLRGNDRWFNALLLVWSRLSRCLCLSYHFLWRYHTSSDLICFSMRLVFIWRWTFLVKFIRWRCQDRAEIGLVAHWLMGFDWLGLGGRLWFDQCGVFDVGGDCIFKLNKSLNIRWTRHLRLKLTTVFPWSVNRWSYLLLSRIYRSLVLDHFFASFGLVHVIFR